MLKLYKCLGAAACLFPALCLADASDYNYAQAGFLDGDLSGQETTGWTFEGSAELLDRTYLRVNFADRSLDEDRNDLEIELRSKSLGLGYVFGENNTASVYGYGGYIETESDTFLDGSRQSGGEHGAIFEVGARVNLSPQAELRLQVDHVDAGAGNEETTPAVGLVYEFTSRIAGTLDYSETSGDSVMGLGLRVYF